MITSITHNEIQTLSNALAEPAWLFDKRMSVFDQSAVSQLGDQSYGIGLQARYSSSLFADGDFSVSGALVSCDEAKVYHFDSAIKEKKLAQLVSRYMFMRPKEIVAKSFSSVTGAAFTDGYLVMIPQADKEFELIITSQEEYAMTYCLVVLPPSATVNVRETIHAPKTHSVIIEYVVSESARLSLIAFEDAKADHALCIHRTILAAKNANASVTIATRGEGVVSSTTCGYALDKDASIIIHNAIHATARAMFDIVTSVVHETAHTHSKLFAREVLADVAHVLHRGNIIMSPLAQGSDGYQKQEALLLSPRARYNPVPNLDIATHDVTCSHGVSATKLSDMMSFYGMSRGLTCEQIQALYIDSYFDEALSLITPQQQFEVKEFLLGLQTQEAYDPQH
ncbi:SufD family Fe-S cluster assembly protein [Candidatus Falkowbacteria bacterium]|nr:SufD family Fe-S cluster assembly protein [Candidatus Falkowbacteria bacterium]